MRFALVSIVDLEGVDFTSLLIYETNENGISNTVAEIAKPFELSDLLDDLKAFKITEIETDSQLLYRELMTAQKPVRYRKTVPGTYEAIGYNALMLAELYELNKQDDEQTPKQFPKWRLFVIALLKKTIEKLEAI